MARKNKRKSEPPQAPGGGAKYVWVATREGGYWRRERGTVKPAELNDTLKKSAEALSIASSAAKRIATRLSTYTRELDMGRFIAKVSAALKASLLKNGKMDFSGLKNYDLQPYNPITDLLKNDYSVHRNNDKLTIKIPINKDTIQRHNKIVTSYFFEAILLWGDPAKEKGLRIESEVSPLYDYESKKNTKCELSLVLPGNKLPWMLLLKISSHEGREMAHHARHYGMKVMAVG
jgi:hypothetical protein